MPDLVLAAVDGSDSLALTDLDSPVYLTAGAQGLDLPVSVVTADSNPYLAGEFVRSVRDAGRDLFLPVLVSGATLADQWAAKVRLFAMLRPTDRTAGSRLTVTDPATGLDRFIDAIYVGGAEGDLSTDRYGRYWQRLGLVLRAPDPYWASTSDQSVTWSGTATTNWFPIFPLNLSPSQILSSSTVAGTTNLVTNPSAEIDLTGWGSLGVTGDPTIARDPTKARFGSVSVRLDWPTFGSSGRNSGYTAAGLTIGVTYTVSVWVWVPTGSPVVQIQVPGIGTGTSSTTNNSWELVKVTFVATGTSHYACVASATATTIGQQVWVDGWQVETGAVATSYCDGDQPGCHWSGVAHASTSVRDATYAGVSLVVDGDSQTWPVWTVNGPGTALSVVHYGQGARFDLVGDIPDGSSVTVDTRPRRQAVYDSAGNNLLGRLSAGFSLFPLDPGRNDISVALTGSSSSSAITVVYTPRWASA